MIEISPCLKDPASELGKSRSPAETVRELRARLAVLEERGLSILSGTLRIDADRLGIPVYLSRCGEAARALLPSRKQMGKGASKEQAEASALMELMERFGFFSFRQKPPLARMRWSEAEKRFGASLLPLQEMLRSVHDGLAKDQARKALDLLEWNFYPITDLPAGKEMIAPLEWFFLLGEFNGSSAGNSAAESLLQGACELVERHVCALADQERPVLPTIIRDHLSDPVLAELIGRFKANGIVLILKDFSLGMPAPTIAALAWDPATFPDHSEIIFTAGTASSPAKAAIRAVTEAAQLAGDFISDSCYEASGLPKFRRIEETAWLLRGPETRLEDLPCLEHPDLRDELLLLAEGLRERGFNLYAVDTTNSLTGIPSHYSFAPGLCFRERDKNASLGLFIGRMLAEQEEDPDLARQKLNLLAALYGGTPHWLPFFHGLVDLRTGETDPATENFRAALPLQPDDASFGLVCFYLAHSLHLADKPQEALGHLDAAIARDPGVKEYYSLRGSCLFKLGKFGQAGADFLHIVTKLDKGSCTDLASLGVCYKNLGDHENARKYLAAALELEPGYEAVKKHLEDCFGEAPPPFG